MIKRTMPSPAEVNDPQGYLTDTEKLCSKVAKVR